jgi:hypothetical protein
MELIRACLEDADADASTRPKKRRTKTDEERVLS